MYTIGIDIGSASSKVVILKNGNEIVATAVVQTGTGSNGPNTAMERALFKAGISLSDAVSIVATGYGRLNSPFTTKQFSEISCHAKGIAHLLPNARTIVDIGGQDVKAIKLDKRGRVVQFVMNDKCAAGTGRFLEVMGRVMEIPLDKLQELDEQAVSVAHVSSTCTVFAESEVISLLSSGTPKADIIAGVHKSVASKATSLVNRIGMEEAVVMSGGVAQNQGVVRALEKELQVHIAVAPNPQTIGALGAALFAYESQIK